MPSFVSDPIHRVLEALRQAHCKNGPCAGNFVKLLSAEEIPSALTCLELLTSLVAGPFAGPTRYIHGGRRRHVPPADWKADPPHLHCRLGGGVPDCGSVPAANG